jgi:Holliday junction resolvase-like predicted endonuclease
MPAKDRYHLTVVRALIKAGWNIVEEQYKLMVGERRLWIDIQAAKAEQTQIILVEVKGLENSLSAVADLGGVV